jgi:Pvc16 N-terminal domain
MSNYLAVPTVTASLIQLFMINEIDTVVAQAIITTDRPDRLDERVRAGEAGINIFLYQIETDPHHNNLDLPTRNAQGQELRLPIAAINLNYLFTFFGNEEQLEPQRLMAWATNVLHAQPALTPPLIKEAIKRYPFLTKSDLADQIDRVRFIMASLDLEGLSKMWSIFFHAHYILSVAYQASVILIEGMEPPPPPALPVQTAELRVLAAAEPVITSVTPVPMPEDGAITIKPGAHILIKGRHFGNDLVNVVFESQSEPTPQKPRYGSEIDAMLPTDLKAGINPLRIARLVNFGTPENSILRPAMESNVFAFTLSPDIQTIVFSPDQQLLSVTAEPEITSDQEVILWLTEEAPPPGHANAYSLRPASYDSRTKTITFSTKPVQPAAYGAVLVVSRAKSSPKKIDIRA